MEAIVVTLGVLLLAVAIVAVFLGYVAFTEIRYRRSQRLAFQDRCPACGYSLSGLRSDTCPECGGLVHPREQAPSLHKNAESRSTP
jgi:rRNA maturation endonuclease Nob1